MKFGILVKYKGAKSFRSPTYEIDAPNEAEALRLFRNAHPTFRGLAFDHFKIIRLREPERGR